jgi:hypothetical protein
VSRLCEIGQRLEREGANEGECHEWGQVRRSDLFASFAVPILDALAVHQPSLAWGASRFRASMPSLWPSTLARDGQIGQLSPSSDPSHPEVVDAILKGPTPPAYPT